ncbi:hypothetical protein O3P69_001828 [Scylla paramamosain]|uniref:Pro-resilin n=1 Tax=Scylla paramamosain TaxID=85552 RepID=A0AAW0V226_SCYPA
MGGKGGAEIAASCLLLAGVVLSQYNYQPLHAPSGLYNLPTTTPRPAATPSPTHASPPAVLRPSSHLQSPSDSGEKQKWSPSSAPSAPSPAMEGMPYDFQYGVQDPESGNTFSHVENSDGRTTQGEYRVLLPDGRTQVVTFYDNGGGFNADVTYI